MAAGAGPEIVPRGPASTPKEPKTISLRFTAPWGLAEPAAPPPGAAPDPAAPPLPGATLPDGPVTPFPPPGPPEGEAAAAFERTADAPLRPPPPAPTGPATAFATPPVPAAPE